MYLTDVISNTITKLRLVHLNVPNGNGLIPVLSVSWLIFNFKKYKIFPTIPAVWWIVEVFCRNYVLYGHNWYVLWILKLSSFLRRYGWNSSTYITCLIYILCGELSYFISCIKFKLLNCRLCFVFRQVRASYVHNYSNWSELFVFGSRIHISYSIGIHTYIPSCVSATYEII